MAQPTAGRNLSDPSVDDREIHSPISESGPIEQKKISDRHSLRVARTARRLLPGTSRQVFENTSVREVITLCPTFSP